MLALPVMIIRLVVLFPADTDPVENSYNLTVRADEDLTAVQDIVYALNKAERHRNSALLSSFAHSMNRGISYGNSHVLVRFIVPTEAIETLKN